MLKASVKAVHATSNDWPLTGSVKTCGNFVKAWYKSWTLNDESSPQYIGALRLRSKGCSQDHEPGTQWLITDEASADAVVREIVIFDLGKDVSGSQGAHDASYGTVRSTGLSIPLKTN